MSEIGESGHRPKKLLNQDETHLESEILDERLNSVLRELSDVASPYRILGDVVDYGVWVCDANGENTYASQSLLDLLGHSFQEIQGLGWASFLHPDDSAETVTRWLECVNTGGDWNREHRFRSASGAYRHVLARGKAIRDANYKVIMWVGINLDITGMKATEEALRSATRSKNRLLAAAGHDLKQPLQAIMGALYRISQADTADARSIHIGRATRAVERLGGALDGLLKESLLEMDALSPIIDRVNLSHVMSGVFETFVEQARVKGIKLRMVPCSIIVETDPDMLHTILSNLLGNAIKFTEAGGVLLGCRRRGNFVYIEVIDTGPGIPDDQAESIFRELSRLNTNHDGFGLGLSIVRRTATLLGVDIKVYSRLGYGSRFQVQIPLKYNKPEPIHFA